MGAELRILILSDRDQKDPAPDEPPLARRADSGAPAAANVFATLASVPGVSVAHRAVFRAGEVLAALGEHRPSVVVNLCEGLRGDSRLEGHAAWMLERVGMAVTGSPHHALRLCLHKLEANRALARAGVRVPATVRVDSPDRLPCLDGGPGLAFPVIVKPEREDGSVGISNHSVVYDTRSLRDRVAEVTRTLHQPAVVQRYIHGRELAVSLLGWPTPRALPPGEIAFDLPGGYPQILTFAAKWHRDSVECTGTTSVPAVLRPPHLRRVVAAARRSFEVLGLRDYGRVDIRLDDRGTPYVIDVNPNCDLDDGSGFALAAARDGLSYAGLLWEIVRGALRRRPDAATPLTSRGRAARISRRPLVAPPAPRLEIA